MPTFRQFLGMRTQEVPSNARVHNKPYATRVLTPPSVHTTPRDRYTYNMASWEMGVLDKILDMVDDAGHSTGRATLVVGQGENGEPIYYLPKSEVDRKWHHEALLLLQRHGVAAKELTPSVTDMNTEITYNNCYRLDPEKAANVIHTDVARYQLSGISKNLGATAAGYASQGRLPQLPGTTWMGR